MRSSTPSSLLCLAGLSLLSQVAAQSTPPSIVFLAQQSPGAPSATFDSRTSIPSLLRAPISIPELQQQLLTAYLHPISRCYVIDSRQFPQTGSNFNPMVPTTHSVCQPASQYHLKGAIATPTK